MSLSPIGRLATALAVGAVPTIGFTAGFAPGGWSHQTTTVSAENTGYPQFIVRMFANQARKSCLSPADAANRPDALLTQDDAAVCKLHKFSMADGKFVFDTFCVNKRFPEGLLIASKGTYTPRSYSMSSLSTGTRKGLPVKIVTTGTGQWTGPTCK
jgi:hypothetical protein